MKELKQNWLDLFSAFRIALDPKKILLGFLAVFLSVGAIWGLLFAVQGLYPQGIELVNETILEARRPSRHAGAPDMTLTEKWEQFQGTPLGQLCLKCREHLSPKAFAAKDALLLLCGGALLLCIWSLFGGSILRGAAVEFCYDDRIDAGEASSFARRKYWSFFWAPIVPLIGICVLKLCIWVAAKLAVLIPFAGPAIFGVFFFLVLLAAFLVVLLVIGWLLGLSLMGPTIAVEGTDAFDAVSRAFSYVFGRPWKYLWYNLVSVVYGVVCVAFVALFAGAVLEVSYRVTEAAMGSAFVRAISLVENGTVMGASTAGEQAWNIGARILFFWNILVWGAVAGFVVSLAGTLNTITYCLLRKDVDGTDMTEVYLEEEEEELPEEAPADSTEAEESSDEGEEKTE